MIYAPKVVAGDVVSVDGTLMKVTKVETNQDANGKWPDNAWPQITITCKKEAQ